ncbi:MAG TPA: hypothetical protein VGG85_13770 [Terracidiphilus sp.]|jgi:hypothetical protein
MKWVMVFALGWVLCSPFAAATAQSRACDEVSTPNQKIDEDTIRRIEQGWITAEYRGNREFLECLLEPDYRTSGKSGQIRSRQEVIDHVSLTTDPSEARAGSSNNRVHPRQQRNGSLNHESDG